MCTAGTAWLPTQPADVSPSIPPSSPNQQVRDFYALHLAPSSPSRRKLSIHIVGRAHAAEAAAPAPPSVELVADPRSLKSELQFWPAVLGDAHAARQ